MPGALNWAQAVNANYALILPEILLTASILLVMILDFYVKNKRQLVWTVLAGVVLAMGAVVYGATDPAIQDAISAGRPLEFFGKMIVADGFTFFLKGVILGIAALVILLSSEFVEKFLRGMHMEFYQVLLAAVLGMLLMVSSRDLIAIYIGLELTSISSYILAGVLRKDPKSNEAALKYFLNGALASAVLLFGVSILYGVSGTTRLPEIALAISGQGPVASAAGAALMPLIVTGIIFVATGFAFKVAAVPMHLWAPDVYEGAPTPVTAFFSVGPKAAAFGGITRVFLVGLGAAPFAERWTVIWAVAAAASMVIGNITAIAQTNIKRMMAYSSIAQAGYILVGVTASGLNSGPGVTAVLFYVMAYAMTNLGIFAVLTHMDQEGGWVEINDMKGLFYRKPLYAVAMLFFFISLIGIPPTVGFLGKALLIVAAANSGYVWLAVLMVVTSVFSVGYYYRVVRVMFLEKTDRGPLTPSLPIAATVVISLAAVVLVTVFANPVVQWTTQAAALLR